MISLLDAAQNGLGVYSIAEAARYAKLPAATIRNWFFPPKGRNPLRRGDIEDEQEKAISFLDFVEALAVRSLRVDYGVTLATIRKAIDFAQTRLGADHIFARKDHKTLLDERKQLHVVLKGERDPIALTGRSAGQASFIECVEGYMLDLRFGASGLADRYTAFQFNAQRIIMSPKTRFGEPIVEENGYPADVLWRGVVAEGSFDRAAALYGASVDSVVAAYRYCHGELGLAA